MPRFEIPVASQQPLHPHGGLFHSAKSQGNITAMLPAEE